MMSNKNLIILGVIAVLMAVWAVFESSVSKRKGAAGTEKFYLIQGLDTGQIAAVEIISGGKQVTLKHRGEQFVVSEKDNYPALIDSISELIAKCLDIETVERRTSNPMNHADLGVAEANAQYIVKFLDKEGSLITGAVISKSDPETNSTYVRLISSEDVYLASESLWLRASALDYVERELLNVERDKILRVEVAGPEGGYTLKSGENSDDVILENVPEDKKVKDSDAKRVFTTLTSLRFDDVKKEGAIGEELKFDLSYICELKDSTVYTLSIAKNEEKAYLKCMAEFGDKTPVKKEQAVESEEDLKAKEAKLLAKDNVENFVKKHTGWIYEIPAYQADNLTKKVSDLLEDVEEEKEGEVSEEGTGQQETGDTEEE
jgi:hypothetical protein